MLRECLQAADVEHMTAHRPHRYRHATNETAPPAGPGPDGLSTTSKPVSRIRRLLLLPRLSSAGIDEARYTRITYELTLAAAEVLARLIRR